VMGDRGRAYANLAGQSSNALGAITQFVQYQQSRGAADCDSQGLKVGERHR